MSNSHRVPPGTSSGGQFASGTRSAGAVRLPGMPTASDEQAHRESISYSDFSYATRRFGPGDDVILHGAANAGRYRVVGALSDDEFLVRGERTGAMVLARMHPSGLHQEVLVIFTGLVDNGRDAQDVMLDVDRANTWIGWTTEQQVRALRRRIRLRLLRNPA